MASREHFEQDVLHKTCLKFISCIKEKNKYMMKDCGGIDEWHNYVIWRIRLFNKITVFKFSSLSVMR